MNGELLIGSLRGIDQRLSKIHTSSSGSDRGTPRLDGEPVVRVQAGEEDEEEEEEGGRQSSKSKLHCRHDVTSNWKKNPQRSAFEHRVVKTQTSLFLVSVTQSKGDRGISGGQSVCIERDRPKQ